MTSWLAIYNNSDCSSQPRAIVILDFDYTITNYHSGGNAKTNGNYIDKDNVNKLNEIFLKMKEANIFVYINTRGVAENVKNYMVEIKLWDNICAIYGAKSFHDTAYPAEWPERKRQINKMILERNDFFDGKHTAIFLDDTKENTDASSDILKAIHIQNSKLSATKKKIDDTMKQLNAEFERLKNIPLLKTSDVVVIFSPDNGLDMMERVMNTIIRPIISDALIHYFQGIPEAISGNPQLVFLFTGLLDGDNSYSFISQINEIHTKLPNSKIVYLFVDTGYEKTHYYADSLDAKWFCYANYNFVDGKIIDNDEKFKISTNKIRKALNLTEIIWPIETTKDTIAIHQPLSSTLSLALCFF